MRFTHALAIVTISAAALPGAAMAQNVGTAGGGMTEHSTMDARANLLSQKTAADIIGMNVVNAAGDSVGSVHDLVINTEGQVLMAVLDVGGFLGINEKRVAIPFYQLRYQSDDAVLLSWASKDQLTAMAEYDQSVQGVWEPYPRDSMLAEAPTGTFGTSTAEQLIGTEVVNLQGDSLGEIENIVIDTAADGAVYAVVGVGGFLGIGEKKVAIPLVELQPGEEETVLLRAVSKEDIENLAAYDESTGMMVYPRTETLDRSLR